MAKVVTVLGARPQFIKAAPLSNALRERNGLQEVIIHTGQHFDQKMSEIFFEEMGIPKPDYNLSIHGLGHGAMTGRMLEGIESVLIKEQPDAVIVFGDTNSTLAGALAAQKIHIPVFHVEAGLRSFNMRMPEEVNRVLTDRISTGLYCPTQVAVDNLLKEGYDHLGVDIIVTGDIMYDAFSHYSALVKDHRDPDLEGLKIDGPYVLATIHRQENTDDQERLKQIVTGLNRVHQKTRVICPLHPRTQKLLKESAVQAQFDCIEPVGYLSMVRLLKEAQFVVTDSGGLQKEAFFAGKPCLTLRDETEWVELIELNVNRLVPLAADAIVAATEDLPRGDFAGKVYGDGKAAAKIVEHLSSKLLK